MLHHIQRGVLNKLATASNLLYSEIKPNELDGNVFGYHLKSLMRDGYVTKKSDGSYSLLPKGREYIVRRYEDPLKSAHSILLIVVRNGENFLLRRRAIQPMLGCVGFIHGEPEPNLTVVEAAKLRILEKTGLNLTPTVKGSALITQFIEGEIQSYSHAIILYAETDQTEIKATDETGENFWSSLEGVNNILPSCHDIIDMIERGDSWLEKSYQL